MTPTSLGNARAAKLVLEPRQRPILWCETELCDERRVENAGEEEEKKRGKKKEAARCRSCENEGQTRLRKTR